MVYELPVATWLPSLYQFTVPAEQLLLLNITVWFGEVQTVVPLFEIAGAEGGVQLPDLDIRSILLPHTTSACFSDPLPPA